MSFFKNDNMKQPDKSTTAQVDSSKSKELELSVIKLEKDLYKTKLDIVTKQRDDALELFQKVLKGYSIVPAIRLWVDSVVKGD